MSNKNPVFNDDWGADRPAGNWGAEPWRAPKLAEGDSVLRSEYGRIIDGCSSGGGGIDYRSHWFILVNAKYGGYAILVKHGGGEERISLGYNRRVPKIIEGLASDDAYVLMHDMVKLAGESRRNAAEAEASKYRAAFANGLLKKRKVRGSNSVKVWIEPAPIKPAS